MFGITFTDDLSAGFAAFGSNVDEVVRLRQNIQVVFDDHHTVARVDQPMHQIKKPTDVSQMKTHGRLFQQKKVMSGSAGASLGMGVIGGDLGRGEFRHEFKPLGLSSR